MEIKREIFRAYDIRGIYGPQLSKETAVQIGAAFGTILRRKGFDNPKVVVGRDNRFSSDDLSVSLIDGLLSAGCLVTDIGLSVTPFVHFSTINFDFDAGIIVTASHNPKEFNGFRFELRNCTPFITIQFKSSIVLLKVRILFRYWIGFLSRKCFDDCYRLLNRG